MSVQSVSSASAAAESGAARKRSAGADGGAANEPFALPEEAEAHASSAAKSNSSAEAKSNAGKAEAPSRAEPASPAAKAPAKVAAPETANAEPAAAAQAAAANLAFSQTGASALLAAAIAVQAEAPLTKDADKGGETSATKEGEETASSIVDPSALLLVAALPAEAAKPVADGFSVDASASAAAVLAGALPAGAGAVLPAAGTGAQAAATDTAAIEASNPIVAAVGKPVAQKPVTTLPLQGSDADKPKGDDAGIADSTALAGHQAAHAAKAGTAEPVSPLVVPDAAQPEFKISEVLQPLQGVIDLSALTQTRAAGLDRPLAVLTPEQAAAQAANAQAQAATGQPTPLHVVPIEIGLRALAGGRKFDIRLDPAELGRVDVSLDITDEGEVTAKLVVDRVETLHLLQRDARTLERAFEQAGLKPSNAGVDITLRDPGDQSSFRQNRQQDDAPRRTPAAADIGEDIGAAAQPVTSTSIRGLVRLGGVDLSI